MGHACNSSKQEAEVGWLPWVWVPAQLEIYAKTLSQTTIKIPQEITDSLIHFYNFWTFNIMSIDCWLICPLHGFKNNFYFQNNVYELRTFFCFRFATCHICFFEGNEPVGFAGIKGNFTIFFPLFSWSRILSSRTVHGGLKNQLNSTHSGIEFMTLWRRDPWLPFNGLYLEIKNVFEPSVGSTCLYSHHLGDKGRRISSNSRPEWSIHKTLGQLELHSETLILK